MAKLQFKTLKFIEEQGKVKVIFLKIFYFYLDKVAMGKISDFRISENLIEFKDVDKNLAEKRFNFLLAKGFDNLINTISNRKTIYIHRKSGIPLMGSNSFGIVDRDTNLIEIKPLTSCNLDCIYCSVDEGKSSKKIADYVVEEEYLIQELRKVIRKKGCADIFIHIGPQGEPLLYADILPLVRDLKKIKEIKEVSLNTNGVLLNKRLIDELINAGLTQFNLSVNALNKDTAKLMAGCSYNLQHIIEICKYISTKKAKLILTPVWLPGYNDREMEKLINLCKKLKCKIGIQNFLNYRQGRNPAKAMPWAVFYDKIRELEKRLDFKLIYGQGDFGVYKTATLEKPFRKGKVVEAMIAAPGRLPNEKLAVAEGRVITVTDCDKKLNRRVKLKITRSKHNIFYGNPIRGQ